ncbi:MAG: hypothetical protein IVW51_16780 [Thermaceae bacterium]|nr:hypothetical protein [Thermaceae bacterium]
MVRDIRYTPNVNMTFEQARDWLLAVLVSTDSAAHEEYFRFVRANPDWTKRFSAEETYDLGMIAGDIASYNFAAP